MFLHFKKKSRSDVIIYPEVDNILSNKLKNYQSTFKKIPRDEIPGTIGRGNLSTKFPGIIYRRELSTVYEALL